MIVKLFFLGRPGSGKSTAYHCITRHIEKHYNKWSVYRVNDYEILHTMFLADKEHKDFRPSQPSGFEIWNTSILNSALEKLEEQARRHISSAENNELIIIEFARDDYFEAFKRFKRDFLKSAYFLYIETDVETCIWRIHDRVAHPTMYLTELDRHFVPDNILKEYYNKDAKPYMTLRFKKDYKIASRRVKIIDNVGSMDDFLEEVKRIVDSILDKESRT